MATKRDISAEQSTPIAPDSAAIHGNGATKPEMPGTNIFDDVANLAIPTDFAVSAAKKVLTSVQIKKPGPATFFRVAPQLERRLAMLLVKDMAEGDSFYGVLPGLGDHLMNELGIAKPMQLYTVMSRSNTLSLWPIALPRADGRTNSWAESAHRAAEMAMRKWIRIQSDREIGGYSVYVANNTAVVPDPNWDDVPPMTKLLELAFKDRLIRDLNHPLLRQLRGEI